MRTFMWGVLAMASLIAALFFLRFWRDSRDRLFVMFGAAFFILAVHRIGLEFTTDAPERTTAWYFVRLLAFLIIIVAIFDKNRKK